ncbi:MAG: InlB B-repeat-containing protein [Treponema sp.]|jgi:hypothetical protein|nr:InlB B-repeat-containing protein [Treponema sp.]
MKKIFLLFAVFSLLLAGCENPLMEKILGNDKNEGEKPGVQSFVFYTVTFNSMGGSYVSSQKLAKGGKAVRPKNPARNDFGFVYWYTDKECSDDNRYNFDTLVTADITLYAKWSNVILTVKFDSKMVGINVDDQRIGEFGCLDEPLVQPIPTPAGLYMGETIPASIKIEKWYRENNIELEWNFDFNGVRDEGITLYAKWDYEPINISNSSTLTNDVEKAIAYLNNSNNTANGAHTLLVSGTSPVSIGSQTISTANFNLTIQGLGMERTIQYNGAATSSLFTISNAGAKLTLGNNITLKGIENGSASLVSITNGTLVMKEGSKITGHKADNSPNAGGVYVGSGGAFTMTGGTISENNGSDGAGVFVEEGGTFTMSGSAKISDNISTNYNGGGVFVAGTFKMTGGAIENNTATIGGGVIVFPNGIFNMSGGTVGGTSGAGNSATVGGGVSVEPAGTFTMSGNAKVSGNTAEESGGGVYVWGQTTIFTMTGGEVSGNTADFGGGMFVVGGGTINMNGGEVLGNEAITNGGGVFVAYNANDGGGGSFNMSGSAMLSGNTATTNGGGVYVTGGGSAFTMEGGEVSGNTANGDGGGVYVGDYGTFKISTGVVYGSDEGDETLRNNATNGAALYNVDSDASYGKENTWIILYDGNNTIKVKDGVIQ